MAHWVGAQGRVGKLSQKGENISPLWRHPQKNPNPKRKIFFLNLNYKTCWIRRGFEQLSRSIGSRGMVLQTYQNSGAFGGRTEDRIRRYIVLDYFSHNSAGDRINKVFKPSTDTGKSSSFDLKKNKFELGLQFSVGDVTMRACCLFGQLYLTVDANPTRHVLVQVFLETRISSASQSPWLTF